MFTPRRGDYTTLLAKENMSSEVCNNGPKTHATGAAYTVARSTKAKSETDGRIFLERGSKVSVLCRDCRCSDAQSVKENISDNGPRNDARLWL
jgi:hypothetical protein